MIWDNWGIHFKFSITFLAQNRILDLSSVLNLLLYGFLRTPNISREECEELNHMIYNKLITQTFLMMTTPAL